MPAGHEDHLWWMGGVQVCSTSVLSPTLTLAAWKAVEWHGNLRKNVLHASEEWIVWCNCLRLWVFLLDCFLFRFQIVAKRYRDFEFLLKWLASGGTWTMHMLGMSSQTRVLPTRRLNTHIQMLPKEWSKAGLFSVSFPQLCELDLETSVSFVFSSQWPFFAK